MYTWHVQAGTLIKLKPFSHRFPGTRLYGGYGLAEGENGNCTEGKWYLSKTGKTGQNGACLSPPPHLPDNVWRLQRQLKQRLISWFHKPLRSGVQIIVLQDSADPGYTEFGRRHLFIFWGKAKLGRLGIMRTQGNTAKFWVKGQESKFSQRSRDRQGTGHSWFGCEVWNTKLCEESFQDSVWSLIIF